VYEIIACVTVEETEVRLICPWRRRGRTASPARIQDMAMKRVRAGIAGTPT
jgi:hypothetical protein